MNQRDEDVDSASTVTYGGAHIARRYQKWTSLYPAEQKVLAHYQKQARGRVLDIAVGAGRTTRHLAPAAAHYIGVDLSDPMISRAQQVFPDTDLRVMDMRNVPDGFSGQNFDLVLISFNSLDYIPWNDRIDLLGRLRMLLSESGVLIVSSHSLEYLERRPVRFRPPSKARPLASQLFSDPMEFAKRSLRLADWLLRAPLNRVRLHPKQARKDGYWLVNDSAENFGLLTYYVSEGEQVRQLRHAGFEVKEVYPAPDGDEDSFFRYVACQKSQIVSSDSNLAGGGV